MNSNYSLQQLSRQTAKVFALVGLSLSFLLYSGRKVAQHIQHDNYQHWEDAATNTIPALLRQNQIADASLALEEVKDEIKDYKAGRLQAGFHIPPQKLAALEQQLDWTTLSNRYLTNASPETEFYQLWREQEQRIRNKR